MFVCHTLFLQTRCHPCFNNPTVYYSICTKNLFFALLLQYIYCKKTRIENLKLDYSMYVKVKQRPLSKRRTAFKPIITLYSVWERVGE